MKETKSYLDLGSQVDDYLGIYYKNIQLTSAENCLKLIEQKVAAKYVDAANDPTLLDTLMRAHAITRRYILDYAPYEDAGLKFMEVQKYLEIPCRTKNGIDFILEGYIDLLVQEEKTGDLYIWDHKVTGAGKGPGKFWNPIQVLMDSQTPTYQAGLRAMGIPVAGIVINQLNAYKYKEEPPTEKIFMRHTTHRTQAELDNILRELSYAVDEMEHLRTTGVYRRSLSKDCDSCWYQEPCLLNMKGLSMEPLLEANYKKKEPKK